MAAGWIKVLGTVPWSDVIGSAPLVADGAKKLWSAVAGKADAAVQPPAAAAAAATPTASPVGPDAAALGALQAQVAALETASADLRGQLLAGTALIQALAEQNAQLVKAAESARVRLVRLAVATALLGVVALAALVVALLAR